MKSFISVEVSVGTDPKYALPDGTVTPTIYGEPVEYIY